MEVWKVMCVGATVFSFPLTSLACGDEGEYDDDCIEEIEVWAEREDSRDDFDDWFDDLDDADWADEDLFLGDEDDDIAERLDETADDLKDVASCTDHANDLRAQCHATYDIAHYGCVISVGFLARAGILRFVPKEFRTTAYGGAGAAIWAGCNELDNQAEAWCDAQADQLIDDCNN